MHMTTSAAMAPERAPPHSGASLTECAPCAPREARSTNCEDSKFAWLVLNGLALLAPRMRLLELRLT